jgi:Eukaryotic DNA topoisomerase I, catalytic core
LPALRERVAADMKLEGLPRERVLATIVSLLEKTLIRVGNAEYAEKNKSYGLTTMRRKHVAIGRGVLRFEFTGKSGKQWKLRVEDTRIASIVKRCADISGHELFKYLGDDGEPRSVDSGDVNAYIKDITGEDFSAKDFRTWAGTVLAALALAEFKKYNSQAEAKRNVVAAIESVSKQLGNTPAICRKCYVHPEILDAYMSGDLIKMIESRIAQKFQAPVRQTHLRRDHGAGFSPQAARRPEDCRLVRAYQSAYGLFFTACLLKSGASSCHQTGPLSPSLRFASSTRRCAAVSASRLPAALAAFTARRAFISCFTNRDFSSGARQGLLIRQSFPRTTK